MPGGFECSKRGACCKLAPRAFPQWPKRADGACVFLTENNLCAVYETRPKICRVDEMRPAGVTVERWYELNAAACVDLQKEAGLGQPV